MIRKTMTVLALAASLGAAMSLGALTAPALAQSAAAKAAVDAGKSAGTVGEQADGYLAIVSGGDASLRAAVAEINTGRAGAYKDIAAKTGVTPEAAGMATAKQLYARMASGQYWKPPDSDWTRK
ncbi:YdbL family protein [soil metagenome]